MTKRQPCGRATQLDDAAAIVPKSWSLGARESANPLLTTSSILCSYPTVAKSLQLNVASMLKRAGLEPTCLVDTTIPVPAVRITELIESSAIEAGVRDFGLRLALARGTPDIGPLNLLLRQEPNLRSALRSLQFYLHLHSRSTSIVLDDSGPHPIIVSSLVPRAAPFAAPQSTEMMVCSILQTLKWLLGANWSPVLTCFSHSAPGDTRSHQAVFGSAVEFDHSFNGLVLTRNDLDRPIAHSSALLRRYAEEYLKSLTGSSPPDFAGAVAEVIAKLLPIGTCSSRRVARQLNIDRSTLGRRLAEVNLTYSSVLQDSRMRLANRLCHSGWPLVQVAAQLGFSSPSVFSRWFSLSFGCSATSWRNTKSEGA